MRVPMRVLVLVMLLAVGLPTGVVSQTPVASPEVTPSAGEGDWRISDVTALALDGRAVAASPDGSMLAGVSADNAFCVWETVSLQPRCTDERLSIRLESIVWSPDGTAVAFSLDAIRMGEESDIYIYETDTDSLVNLTDDGVEGFLLRVPADTPMDDVPVWSPDSRQLAFARSERGEEAGSTTIMRIDRDGGALGEIHRLPVPEPFVVWMPMAWLPDGNLYLSQLSMDLHDDRNGIWRVPVDGGAAELVLPGSELSDVPGPYISSIDAERGVAIVHSYYLLGSWTIEIDRPLFWRVDLATGEKTSLEPEGVGDPRSAVPPRVVTAAFSPDGAAVIAWAQVPQAGYALVIIDTETGATTELEVATLQESIMPIQPQWTTNGRVVFAVPTGPVVLTLERDA
jgi:WD40 repeat protein